MKNQLPISIENTGVVRFCLCHRTLIVLLQNTLNQRCLTGKTVNEKHFSLQKSSCKSLAMIGFAVLLTDINSRNSMKLTQSEYKICQFHRFGLNSMKICDTVKNVVFERCSFHSILWDQVETCIYAMDPKCSAVNVTMLSQFADSLVYDTTVPLQIPCQHNHRQTLCTRWSEVRAEDLVYQANPEMAHCHGRLQESTIGVHALHCTYYPPLLRIQSSTLLWE